MDEKKMIKICCKWNVSCIRNHEEECKSLENGLKRLSLKVKWQIFTYTRLQIIALNGQIIVSTSKMRWWKNNTFFSKEFLISNNVGNINVLRNPDLGRFNNCSWFSSKWKYYYCKKVSLKTSKRFLVNHLSTNAIF